DFFNQRQQRIDDAVDAAANDNVVENVVERQVGVGHFLAFLEAAELVAFLQLRGELIHIEAVRTPGILAPIGARRLVVVGNEDRTRDAPIGAVGAMAALRATLGVLVPLAEQPIGMQKMRRDRPPAAATESDQALGIRIG